MRDRDHLRVGHFLERTSSSSSYPQSSRGRLHNHEQWHEQAGLEAEEVKRALDPLPVVPPVQEELGSYERLNRGDCGT